MAENRSGNSEPSTPAPIMMSAVLTRGGATRQGILMTRPRREIGRISLPRTSAQKIYQESAQKNAPRI
jgi:hypothetical protein